MRALVALVLAATASAALLGQEGRRRRVLREARGAEVTCAVTGCASGYFASGKLYQSFTPPGMAYRQLLRPLLSPNQRVAFALATGALGISGARVAMQSDGFAANLMQQIGQSTARVGDQIESFFSGFAERSRFAREERERRARQQWLRENAKPAKVHVRTH